MKPRRGPGRMVRRTTTLVAAVALLVGVAAVPAGAESETPGETKQRVEQEIRDTLRQVAGVVDGIESNVKNDLGQAVGQLASGDVQGAQQGLVGLGHEVECTAIEAAARYAPYPRGLISYDIPSGLAFADITVPNASDGTPCVFEQGVEVVTVSWGLYLDQWGVLPQWEEDTDAVTVTGSGTYRMQVGLPGPTADPEALAAAQDLILGGESGAALGDAAGPLSAAADGLSGIIDGIIGSLTPDQISGILDFICPFQVDTFRASAADVPQTLGGGFGTTNLTDPNVSVLGMLDGVVVETPEIAAAGRDSGTAVAKTLGASADLDASAGGLDLGNLDWETLCVDPEPPEVGGIQETNIPTDSGTEVAGASTLPRTGTETPGVVAVGLALILAGWLVLTANALTRARRRNSTGA